MSHPAHEAGALFRGVDQTSMLEHRMSRSLVRLPIAKLLTPFFAIMSCEDRRPGEPVAAKC